jgi:hypothetical protein
MAVMSFMDRPAGWRPERAAGKVAPRPPGKALRGSRLRISASRSKIKRGGAVLTGGLWLTCGQAGTGSLIRPRTGSPTQPDGKALRSKAPILIAEVLSPGTYHVDFGDKRHEYLRLPTLDTYLILDPDGRRAWIWRPSMGHSPPSLKPSRQRTARWSALAIDLLLDDIYRGVC